MRKTYVTPISRQAIWEYVRDIRSALSVDDKLYFDIVNFIERVMPELFPDFIFEICSEIDMGNLHGETIPSEHTIRVREDVYIGACKGNGRDRLTLAHEVGHYLMHNEHSIVLAKTSSSGTIPNYYDPDWQADVFGGELLAPSYLIYNMTPQDIQNMCSVSIACAERQLYAIDCEKKKGFRIKPTTI